jgi:hypothetical protein
MTPDEFAAITENAIADEGFDGFQPTACFPERREVRTLAGFPEDEDPEQPVLEWAADLAGDEEFLVAFKIDASHFKIIRKAGNNMQSGVYEVAQQTVQPDRREDAAPG